MQEKISIFSFFSGIGILDLAFEKNGYNIVFVNEYDNLFIESYRYARMQMNLRAPIYGYRNDSAERYARRRGKKNLLALIAQEREKGNLVGFIGGPPCPDFSVAGKNAGVDGENGRLTKIYFDIICRCHPDFFLFENVKGLVKTEKHRAFYKEMMMKVQANVKLNREIFLPIFEEDYSKEEYQERVDRFIFFATNGCGDYYCYRVCPNGTADTSVIYIWEHENIGDRCCWKPVANNIKELIVRYCNGEI